MKKIWNKTWEILLKHSTTVYTTCILAIISMGLFLYVDIQHTKQIVQLEKDKAELWSIVNTAGDAMDQQREVIDLQGELMVKQRGNINEAQKIIQMQEQIIGKLIEYLKALGEWPPATAPIDPDKWT